MAYFPTSIMPMYNGNIPVNQVLSELINYVKFPIVHIDGDKIPYNFRPTNNGTRNIGDRETDMLVGGTVAFNQLSPTTQKSFTAPQNGNTLTWIANNAIVNHVLLLSVEQKTTMTSNVRNTFGYNDGTGHYFNISTNNETSAGVKTIIFKPTANCTILYWCNTPDVDVAFDNAMVFDLTAMFGATIADYIYNLEQGTAGSGVAWFRNLFPKPYYAYNAGELMSVKTSKHITTGFNAYDNSTGKAKVVGGNQYQITGTYTSLTLDGETITPNASGIFTPDTSGEITVVGGNATDTCIHLVWDGERNGEYEPYVKHEYALDSDLELRGIPKLDSNNKLYYDGDTYESDGTVTRKYGIVDLGSLTWSASSASNTFVSNADEIPAKKQSEGSPNALVCAKYDVSPTIVIASNLPDKNVTLNTNDNKVVIHDSAYSDKDVFKTAMNGVYLVYELATPTAETADTFTNPQIVNDFGTEEYVDTREVAIPVGHETEYQTPITV